LYDSNQYATCPYCNGGGNRIEFSNAGGADYGRTSPVGGGFGTSGVSPAEIGATVAPQAYRKREEPEEDTGKTVGVFKKSMNLEPVVGWLVCIEGPEKGKDFHIWAKNNTIGRSEKMDICIKGDTTISRENHARLAYDEKHNNFHLIPAENTNNIYLNDEPIYVPSVIEAYDMIEFGESKLMFVPLCDDRFNWKDGLKTQAKDEVKE
jgi:hypothetical protein